MCLSGRTRRGARVVVADDELEEGGGATCHACTDSREETIVEIHSQWTFDCRPEHVWPHFLHARMDDTRPLLFRLGVPKPVSCRVLEGTPAVGNTRQCMTDRGTIDQRILVL